MKKNGFISSALLYGILSLFIVLMLSSLAILGNRKITIDKIKTSAIDDVSHSNHLYVASYGSDEEGIGTLDRPYKTIAKAYNEAAADSTIFIMSNITQTSTVTLNQNKIITLKSYGNNAKSIIRGSSFTNNFLNVTNGTLNLQNITLDGNNVTSQGSLIGVSGEGTNLTTNTGTTLKNNNNGFIYQNDGVSLEKLGGAISISNKANVTINNTTITGNTGDYGGGIYHSSEKVLNVTGSTINSNTSRHSGGAIASNYEIKASSSTMDSNKASTEGGALFSGKPITLTGVNLTNNTSSTGGGVSVRKQLIVNGNSKINNNKATNGGGIYINTRSGETTTNATIENATISGNTATNYGGGIYSMASNLAIKNSATISNNNANVRGGGIDMTSRTFTMTGGSITGNKITTGGAGHDGGGVMLDNVTSTMSGGSITNNTSLHTGGGIQMYKGTFNLTGGSITGNTGTGLAFYNGATFTVKGGTINSNSGDARGYAANINYGTNDQFADSKSGYTSNSTVERIVSAANNGFSIDVQSGTVGNNTNIQLYTNNTNTQQKWDVHPYRVENGVVTYVFVSQLGTSDPRQCLWVSGNSATAGANVITYQFHGNAGGYWTLENMGSSYYRVKNISGLCLDLVNGTAANGTNIRTYTCNTANAQKWKFVNV